MRSNGVIQDPKKYSDQFVDWLVEEGYTHCFFLAGGNIMHLLDSVRTRMTCIPFVNEIGAAIAVEYFNEINDSGQGKAFALVTAGPGLTNTVTAISSAWMESRELLVVGGQVKTTDLMSGGIRQRGIQEIDGVKLVSSICKASILVDKPLDKNEIISAVRLGASDRKGPVFLEMCLDVQAAPVIPDLAVPAVNKSENSHVVKEQLNNLLDLISKSERPVLLLGGGISRATVREIIEPLKKTGIPVMTTWNGADRISSDFPNYFGRPNTWGQRSSNIILQQADLLIALGTRLGIQQTGFAWEEFLPIGKVVQIDVDQAELQKGHPRLELAINADANEILRKMLFEISPKSEWNQWRDFAATVRELVPLNDPANSTKDGFVKPYEFFIELSNLAGEDDFFIPSSSGAAETVAMQSINNKNNQRIVMNKGMASMGYGLSGAIGAALAAHKGQRTFLFEGDGSFAQNLQELGTVAANNLNLKMFLFTNDGYASIRTTQRNYFNGAWIGCDSSTGLGLPKWELLAQTYGIPFHKMDGTNPWSDETLRAISSPGPTLIEVPADPDQTYYPKIMSRVLPDGSMKSQPLHLMSPDLPTSISEVVFPHLSIPEGDK